MDSIDYDKIEHFLLGQLADEEVKEIQRRIDNDAEFAAAVEWMKQFLSTMQHSGEMNVLQTFDKVHRRPRRKPPWKSNFFIAAVAAILLLCIALLVSKWWPDPEQDQVDQPETESAPIVAGPAVEEGWENFVEYNRGLQTLGEEDDRQLDSALNLLSQGERKAALPLLEAYLAGLSSGDDYEIRIETAKIYLLEMKDYAKAAANFEQVSESDANPQYRAEARYYMALTLLAQEEVGRARVLLNDIVNAEQFPYWQSKAQTLLDSIE